MQTLCLCLQLKATQHLERLPVRALGKSQVLLCSVAALRRAKDTAVAAEVSAQEQSAAAAEQQRQRETERRMHPRRPADFALIEDDLEAWRTKVQH